MFEAMSLVMYPVPIGRRALKPTLAKKRKCQMIAAACIVACLHTSLIGLAYNVYTHAARRDVIQHARSRCVTQRGAHALKMLNHSFIYVLVLSCVGCNDMCMLGCILLHIRSLNSAVNQFLLYICINILKYVYIGLHKS